MGDASHDRKRKDALGSQKLIEKSGSAAPQNKGGENMTLKVEGMMCTGCENRIQNAVKNMNGIKSVKADHTTGTVKIEAEDGIEESKIKEKIENIGFDVK